MRASAAPASAALAGPRSLANPRVVAALLGFLAVAPLAASDGGYWPTAWSWTTLAFAWVAALALLLREEIRAAPLERVFFGLLVAVSAWIAVSLAWTTSFGRTALEVERALTYVAVVLAAIVLVRARSHSALLGGVWSAISLVSGYALATRLFPERLGVFDPVAGYRLSEPLGYWNALGIFAGMGALLALGLAARSGVLLIRCLAAASLVLLLPTVYFTFSRGAWIGIAIGFAGAIVLDRRRLQLVTAALALAPAPAIGLALAYQSDALTRLEVTLDAASRAGHRLALVLFVLAIVNALVAFAFEFAERRVSVPDAARRAYAAVLALVLVAAVAATFVRFGSPPTLVRRAQDALEQPAPRPGDLNERLFTLSSKARVTAWRAARMDARDHAALGSGGGTFELYWYGHRPAPPTKIRDAHSLYLESLAELGPVGLTLLVAALLVPVAGAIRARRHHLVPPAFAAYVAYLVHAGVDWDWEMPAVTITALLCGVVVLATTRRAAADTLSRRWRLGLLAGPLVLAAVAFVGINGNRAVANARDAADAGRFEASEAEARKAEDWMPWSSEPWQLAGDAQLARGALASARQSFRTALDKDPDDWELWQGFAAASKGAARRQAVANALALNPLDPDLVRLGRQLGIAGAEQEE